MIEANEAHFEALRQQAHNNFRCMNFGKPGGISAGIDQFTPTYHKLSVLPLMMASLRFL